MLVQNIIGKKSMLRWVPSLKDMLMSMRFRSKLDEKIHAQTEQKQMN
jgi:hypothetical protein